MRDGSLSVFTRRAGDSDVWDLNQTPLVWEWLRS